MRAVVALTAFFLAVGVGVSSAPARAQSSDTATRAAARKLGYEGVEALQAGQPTVAHEKLERAYAALRVPSLGVWSARAMVQVGKLVEAADRFVEVSRLPVESGDVEIQKKAQAEAQTELEAVQRSTPTLRVSIQSAAPGVVVEIDGAPLASSLVGEATPLNPGRHRVRAVLDGREVNREVTLALNQAEQITLSFEASEAGNRSSASHDVELVDNPGAAPADSGSARRTLGWVLLSGGAAGVVMGGVTGALAMSKQSSLDEDPACADQSCPPQYRDDVSSLNAFRTVSTVGFIAGGVLAAAGLTLVLTAPRSQSRTALSVSASSVTLSGEF